jgi:hypothetical protein
MTLQLLPSEFPYIYESFLLFFISVVNHCPVPCHSQASALCRAIYLS